MTLAVSSVGLPRIQRRAFQLDPDGGYSKKPQPLREWRLLPAYVLLGDPGAGKSEAFRMEAATDPSAQYITARDFIAGIGIRSGVNTFYIDGLDEERAGGRDGRSKLDEIRARLDCLGRPRARLSCREADWLGVSDLNALKALYPDLEVLHLHPFEDEEILEVLHAQPSRVPDAASFLETAERFGLDEMLRNPLLLDLTVRAVQRGGWPGTRAQLYQQACIDLVTEHSDEHSAARHDLEELSEHEYLNIAGMICAVLLMSGRAGVTSRDSLSRPDWLALRHLGAQVERRRLSLVIATKLFAMIDGVSAPLHRSIAEYLAARYLARRLDDGLPLGRILALITAPDGRPVTPLRGLLGWLAALWKPGRERLLRLDPMAVVLYGDVAALDDVEGRLLLEALWDRTGQGRPDWTARGQFVGHALAALATPSMAQALKGYLETEDASDFHQLRLSWLLGAFEHGRPLPALSSTFERIVVSGDTIPENRVAAYRAWSQAAFDPAKALAWLDGLNDGSIPDSDRQLLGHLLEALYPVHVGPEHVFDFLHGGSVRILGGYWRFWTGLVERTPTESLPALAESWLRSGRTAEALSISDVAGVDLARLIEELMFALLSAFGHSESTETIYRWLGMGVDRHGFSVSEPRSGNQIASWLEAHPETLLELLAFGYEQEVSKAGDWRRFWRAERRLHGARRPRSMPWWHLEQACHTMVPDLARYHLDAAASMIVIQPDAFDAPPLEAFDEATAILGRQFADAQAWLEAAWTSPITEDRFERGNRKTEQEIEIARAREERRQYYVEHLPGLRAGTAPDHVLHQIVEAYRGGFVDVAGETALGRVANLLVTDDRIASEVLERLPKYLERADLPGSKDTLALYAKGQVRRDGRIALLAARLAQEHVPDAPDFWSDERVEHLVALFLADGHAPVPGWYLRVVATRPGVVARLLVAFASREFRKLGKRGPSAVVAHVSGDIAESESVARLALPPILAAFPLRSAGDAAKAALNRLLRAAGKRVDRDTLAALVQERLADPRLSAGQRACWLVAALRHDEHAVGVLVGWVGKHQRRMVAAGDAISQQQVLDGLPIRLAPRSLASLIRMLVPVSPAGQVLEGWVDPAMRRGEMVNRLLEWLESDPAKDATEEIDQLMSLAEPGPWYRRLAWARDTQRTIAREHAFEHATPEAILATLENLAPANPADLQALMVHHLVDLEKELRGADTYLLRAFWNPGDDSPQPEVTCRDQLLAQLRPRLLPLGIKIEREASAAEETRPDMRVEFVTPGVRIAVPLEVKKDSHRELWTAWRDQLDGSYTNDPGCQGRGVYVVFWFGTKKSKASPEGMKPASAIALQQAIVNRIPPRDRNRLAVVVLDLSMVR